MIPRLATTFLIFVHILEAVTAVEPRTPVTPTNDPLLTTGLAEIKNILSSIQGSLLTSVSLIQGKRIWSTNWVPFDANPPLEVSTYPRSNMGCFSFFKSRKSICLSLYPGQALPPINQRRLVKGKLTKFHTFATSTIVDFKP